MAKITTITNPLTGQPAQVDQLEHTAQQIDDAIARALPGGAIDITLQNNDPKKWGLGIVLANTPGAVITDFDEILPTGFYYVQSGSLNRPINGAIYATVINRSYDYVTVFAESTDGVIARRRYNGSSWGVWEYLNPPMMSNTDTEYRTTERYMGKPVYAKLLYCGAFPNNAEKKYEFGISGIQTIVEHYEYNTTDPIPSHNLDTSPVQDIKVNLVSAYNGGFVRVQTNYDASGSHLYVKLKYTKSTD